jgi:actin-related protein 9
VNGHERTLKATGSSEEVRPSASASRASSPPRQAGPRVKDYLVGVQLDEALAAGQDIEVLWPFANGEIDDYTQAEAIWCANSMP